MKAKTTSLAILCLLASFAMYAQTSDAEAEAMANLLGVQKKEIIMKLVSISGKDSVTFWKLYDEYLQKNKSLTKQRIQLYEQTARSYNVMTPGALIHWHKDILLIVTCRKKVLASIITRSGLLSMQSPPLNFTRQKLTC